MCRLQLFTEWKYSIKPFGENVGHLNRVWTTERNVCEEFTLHSTLISNAHIAAMGDRRLVKNAPNQSVIINSSMLLSVLCAKSFVGRNIVARTGGRVTSGLLLFFLKRKGDGDCLKIKIKWEKSKNNTQPTTSTTNTPAAPLCYETVYGTLVSFSLIYSNHSIDTSLGGCCLSIVCLASWRDVRMRPEQRMSS